MCCEARFALSALWGEGLSCDPLRLLWEIDASVPPCHPLLERAFGLDSGRMGAALCKLPVICGFRAFQNELTRLVMEISVSDFVKQ